MNYRLPPAAGSSKTLVLQEKNSAINRTLSKFARGVGEDLEIVTMVGG
jgi:hypothetical protein